MSLAPPAAFDDGPNAKQLLTGAAWGIAATMIWAGWWVITRFSVTNSLDFWDLTALRFMVSGLILLPIIMRQWPAIRKVSPILLVLMMIGAGAPYTLAAGGGLKFATAGNGGALAPGVLPLFTALLAVVFLGDRISRWRQTGLALIVVGVVAIAGHGLAAGTGATPGHILFILGALMWAGFTISLRKSGLSALTGTAVVSVFSMLVYMPFYLVFFSTDALFVSLSDTAIQAIVQGVLTAIAAVFCYSRAVMLLGPARGSVFPALMPVMTTIMGMIFLAEIPSPQEVFGVVSLSFGVYLASGAVLRRVQPKPA